VATGFDGRIHDARKRSAPRSAATICGAVAAVAAPATVAAAPVGPCAEVPFVGVCVPVSEQPHRRRKTPPTTTSSHPHWFCKRGSARGRPKVGCDEQRAPERTKAISMCLPCD
jgi:hypothetical protein